MNTFININKMFCSKTINSTGFTLINSFSTFTINRSLSTRKIPEHFKEAIIRPLIGKMPNIEVDEIQNYRLVSNLNFVLNIIKQIVIARIECLSLHNNLYEPTQ